jgi:uroporphyrinogen-III synthase
MTPNGLGEADGERLRGLRVVSFESRRATEMAELIRRHGGEPISAPSVREVPLEENRAAVDYVAQLEAGEIAIVILMTGVGLRTLAHAVAGDWPRERLAAALRRATLVARGPKPVAALREFGLQPDITVPEPNTWREILATLDAQLPVAGKRVAVQEYGVTNAEFVRALETRGAQVLRVPIYEWALPEDIGPLRNAIDALCVARVDIALFTSATQVYHLFQVAGDNADRLRDALGAVLIASIGPVCSEALREHGVEPDLEPRHSKMGQLVGEVARRGKQMLAVKRAS